jgi:hypothetical protein
MINKNKYQRRHAKTRITSLTVQIALTALFVALFALNVSGGDKRLELRNRLDSLEVEKQVLKRQGKPIDDLEASSALLRDSLVEMRGGAAAPQEAQGPVEGGGGSLWADALAVAGSFLESNLSFRPAGLFDWIIVGTGVVAILSALLLMAGIVVGRRKPRPAPRKAAGRKVNLAPTGPRPAIAAADSGAEARYRFGGIADLAGAGGAPAGSTYNAGGRMNEPKSGAADSPEQVPPELESLMESLRKAASTKQQAPQAGQPAAAPPRPAPAANTPPQPPPPLIVNAPDTPQPPPPAAAAPRVGSQGFSDLVISESKGGLSDAEISRRYQVSVDQVRLILRMMKR